MQKEATTVQAKEVNGSTSNKEMSVDLEDIKMKKVVDDAKTIIGMDSGYWSNNYDHFSYNADYDKKALITNQRINVIAKYCGNDFVSYQEKVSDHVPIALSIELY